LRAQRPLPYSLEPQTIGEHIRKKRYESGLFQHEVAEKIGVDKTTIFNWENGLTQPKIRSMPKIFEFLGYIPSVAMSSISSTLGDRIIAYRKLHGIHQKKFARELGVDHGTLRSWEKNKSVPCKRMMDVLESHLSGNNLQHLALS
jgi:transcriptional regulator with XRE-family HTH domain